MEYLPISQDGSNRCWPLPRYLLYFLFLLFFCQEAETICLNWLRHLFRIWTSLVIQLLVLIKYVLLFFFIYFLVLSTTIRTLKDVIIFDNPALMCLHLWYKLWDAMKEQSKLLFDQICIIVFLYLFFGTVNNNKNLERCYHFRQSCINVSSLMIQIMRCHERTKQIIISVIFILIRNKLFVYWSAQTYATGRWVILLRKKKTSDQKKEWTIERKTYRLRWKDAKKGLFFFFQSNLFIWYWNLEG